MRGRGRSTRGQMTVELAVLVPVIIVVALIVLNLGHYVELCARFDRVALDAVLAEGVAPSGRQDQASASRAVQSSIESAMGTDDGCTVRVTASGLGEGPGGATFTLSPLLTRFDCVMEYKPWPHSFVLAGVPFTPPGALRHERSIVVDRFKPGVVV